MVLCAMATRLGGPARQEKEGDSSSPRVLLVPSGTGLGLNACLSSIGFYCVLYFLATSVQYFPVSRIMGIIQFFSLKVT